MAITIKEIAVDGYEKIIEAQDSASGLHCIIAVHSTVLGPALGGTRIYPYATREQALTDALRLAKGMTYKSAVARTGLGGGKSVIIADPKTQKTPELLYAFAEALNSLNGLYICAEDVGSTLQDMAVIRSRTPYVSATADKSSSGDPSPFTAWGVYRGLQAVANRLWGADSLAGRTVAIQGLGSVGGRVADTLFWNGAKLILADVNRDRAEHLAHLYGATVVDPVEIHAVDCDIFAPCALGGVLNDETIPQLKCVAVAGAANNQLLRPEHGEMLRRAGILYAPDFVINAGGIINIGVEVTEGNYNATRALELVEGIYEQMLCVFDIADELQISTSQAADELAEQHLSCTTGCGGN